MRVLIVSANTNKNPMPVIPIGACTAAAAAENYGASVRFLDLMFSSDPLGELDAELEKFPPDLAGISLRNIDNNDIQNPCVYFSPLIPITEIIRAGCGAEIVLGGAAFPLMPEQLLRVLKIKWGILGRGETIFPRFLAALKEGDDPARISGVAWLRDDVYGQNPLPFIDCMEYTQIDFSRWLNVKAYQSGLATMPLQTRRGCPYKCIYCTYAMNGGEVFTVTPPKQVAASVRNLVSQGFREIEFVDNVFNAPYEYALTLCEELIRADTGARFHSFELNPAFVTGELLSLMQRAGFTDIGITAESSSDIILKNLGKNYSSESLYSSVEIVRKYNMPCLWIFMLGGPGETKETVYGTLEFASKNLRAKDAAFFNLGVRIYPDTELEKIARREGIFKSEARDMLYPVFYLSPNIEKDWLICELDKFIKENLNFINPALCAHPLLPYMQRICNNLRIKPHFWKYTRHFRRLLRFMGSE